jgi:adenylate kinase family enzyme
MKKVIIIGSSGAGKTTFAKKLAEKTGLPLYHLDSIWHKADRSHITREEFDRILGDILSKDSWMIDGE